ncbi:protein NO VEIN domain-containing protein [Pseudomonas fluorescens]|uniref:protein NO VEIN domain-containing protein n=1 Tax=Pseudomonas TaxID=286 RepID=UPI003D07038A
MSGTQRCWLLLEKSDQTRVSKGIDGYQDKTGEEYRYDSLVPNFKNIKTGDIAILRKEDEILGFGRIGIIAEAQSIKTHRRCPSCKSTDIRERKTKTPKWKCGHCAIEFFEPDTTEAPVMSFTANLEGFAHFGNPPPVQAIKLCSASGDGLVSQLSMMQLDFETVRTLLEGTDIQLSPRSRTGAMGQGLGLSSEERKCVELHAMGIARKLYEDAGWSVIDTSASQPYDLFAALNAEKRFIEVKGTTGEGASIILTSGEVIHAKANPQECALVVVSEIRLENGADGLYASDGKVSTHLDSWCPEEDSLEATQYRYRIKND